MDRGKKAGVAILISDKIDFKRRAIKRDPDGHIIIKMAKFQDKERILKAAREK